MADTASTAASPVEQELWEVGRALHAALPGAARHPVRALDQRALRVSASDRDLRTALFRLVDVTPACRTLDDLARHLGEYANELDETPPSLARATRLAHTAAGRKALGAAATLAIRHMAHRFIVGDTPADAIATLRDLWDRGIACSLDLLGEATVTEAEADRYAARCIAALETLAAETAPWPDRPALEADAAGALARVNLSVKVTALTPLIRPEAPELGREDAARRVRPLLRRARELGGHVHFDMESLDTLETTLELALELLGEEEFRDGPSAGVVLQAYLRDSPSICSRMIEWAAASEEEFRDGPSAGVVLQAYLRDSPSICSRMIEWAAASGRATPLTVRLVKGAYWDHEIVEARQEGWPAPVFEHKADCDRNFEELTRRLLDARPAVRVAVASHNLRSVAHAIAYNRARGGADGELELQVLRGLGDELAEALASHGLRVRAYCPVGDLVAGMAYLVRRLLENTSNESFLGDMARGADVEELLRAPWT